MRKKQNEPVHGDAVRRAALPEVLFVPDLALALGVSASAARKAILRGACGPYLRLGRRLAVLRESFMAALEARQVSPSHRATLQLVRRDGHSRAPGRTDARGDQDEDE